MDKDGFIKVIDINDKDEITREVLNGGTFSQTEEEKMLIEMTGISVNATPRKDGRYQGYIRTENGKRYAYGKTRDEVIFKLKVFLKEDKPTRKKRIITPLFKDYATEWVERYKKPNLKPKSLESLNNALKKAIGVLGKKEIGRITTDDLQNFFTSLPPSRSRDLCAVYVGQVFKKAHATGIIKKNPFEQVELKKHVPEKRNALTPEEQDKFLTVAKKSSHYLLFRFLLSTGLRIGEALALTPEDFKDGKVFVTKDIVFVDGKEIIQPPKSKAGIRTVPVPDDIFFDISKIKTSRVFPIGYNTVRLAFVRVSKNLGFTVTAHMLRHTYATRLEEAGLSPKIKQYLLGHSSIEMTQNVYTDTQGHYIDSLSDGIRAVFDTK